jgi:thioredoxin 1
MRYLHPLFTYLSLLIIISCLFIAATTDKKAQLTAVSFFQGSLQSAKAKAAAEGKPFFVDFMATWCMPCRWMDETTYKNTKLANYISDNYLAVKIDIDDFDGFALKEEYEIKYLPSILVFSAKGKLLAQYEESLPAAKLLSILKEFEVPVSNESEVETPALKKEAANEMTQDPKPKRNTLQAAPTEYTYPVLRPDKDKEKMSLTRPVLKPNAKPTTTITTTSPTIIKPLPATPMMTANTVKPIWRDNEGLIVTGLYRFNVVRQPTKGYGIQLGAYLSYSNVISEVAKMQEKYTDIPVVIHIENAKGKPTYKLYLGTFKKKLEASNFVKQEKITGFIRDYASL